MAWRRDPPPHPGIPSAGAAGALSAAYDAPRHGRVPSSRSDSDCGAGRPAAAPTGARAESQLTLGERDLARAERLLSSNAMACEEVDSRRATVRAARADCDAAKAALRAASLELEFMRVTAPVSGRVSSTLVDVGNLVTGGAGAATVLTSIVSRTPIYFTFDVSEADYLSYLRLSAAAGQSLDATRPVHVKLLDETEWIRAGELDFVDNQFDQAIGTIRMRASFNNADGLLVPGIFGRLRLAASPEYETLLIPDRAILSDQSHRMVMVVGADDVVQVTAGSLGTAVFSGMLGVTAFGLIFTPVFYVTCRWLATLRARRAPVQQA